MGLRIATEYIEANVPDANYPGGSFKNTSTPGGVDGTPLEKAWTNDLQGFFQRLILEKGITVSDVPDTVVNSDYYDALIGLFAMYHDNVADMIAADLQVGSIVRTKEYLSGNGLGGATYKIVAPATGINDGGEFIDLTNTNQAQLIISGPVKASQYGAVGNGATDDTTKIQALIDAFKDIIIDTNSVISAALNPSVFSNIVISNDIIAIATATTAIDISSIVNVTITFTPEASLIGDGSTLTQKGIVINNCNNIVINNATITNCKLHGIILQAGSSSCIIDNPLITGATASLGVGIRIINIDTTNNRIIKPRCNSNTVGIDIRGGKNNVVEQPLCNSCTDIGILLTTISGSDDFGAEQNTIISPQCNDNVNAALGGIFISEDAAHNLILHPECNDNAGAGIMIKGITGFEATNNRIISPVCIGNGVNGITLELCEGLEIENPTMLSNTNNGINILDCIEARISGGIIKSNTLIGINVESGSIAGLNPIRLIMDSISITNNGSYGIRNAEGAKSYQIQKCYVENNVIADILFPAGSSGIKFNNCTGNLITENGTNSSAIASITISHGLSILPQNVDITITGGILDRFISVTSITSSDFTVTLKENDGTTPTSGLTTFIWKAIISI